MLWFDSLWDDLSSSSEGRTYLRLSDGTAKILREELFPTAIFLRHESHDEDAEIEFPADSGKRDAILFGFDHGLSERNLEIVNAIDGYDDRLRTEFLERHGRVSITGDIERSKNARGQKIIKHRFKAKLHDETLDEAKTLVSRAIQKKIELDYDPRTWLLVAFDDGLFRIGSDYEFIRSVASSFCFDGVFERVYLVGKSRGEWCCRVF